MFIRTVVECAKLVGKTIKPHLKYFKYVFLHKYWVFVEGVKRGLFFRVIWHDMDKFLPEMWGSYANYFNGEQTSEVKARFRRSWRGHVNRNDHHYNHWVGVTERGDQVIHEMSDKARKEMLADWISANRVIAGTINHGNKGDLKSWYNNRRDLLPIGPKTKRWLDAEINKL